MLLHTNGSSDASTVDVQHTKRVKDVQNRLVLFRRVGTDVQGENTNVT